MQKTVLIVIAVVALVIIGWALWPTGEKTPPPTPEPIEAPPLTAPQAPQPASREPRLAVPEEPEQRLPPLPESDPFVRERLEPMHLPEQWVKQGDYVRRLAVLAENASRGTYPRRQLSFLEPQGEFKVVERDDRLFVDPAGYDRYDRFVEELEATDPGQVAGLVESLDPLVESALTEIGVEAPPGEVFEGAVKEVLAVPDVDGEVELVQPNVVYKYADPRLESLSPLQKQVLRMGPDNVARLKAYLRKLAEAMDLNV